MKSKIYIKYKDGILDPQGTVTNKALKSIGMKNIDSISIGKFIEINFNDVSKKEAHPHEAELLKLNCDKALFDLDWRPTLEFKETVKMTVEWYKKYYQNKEKSLYNFSIAQINEYIQLAKSRDIAWTKND